MPSDAVIEVHTFGLQCRCCMVKDPPLFELFEFNLDLILAAVADVLIERSDGLPELICEECAEQAKAAFRFKQQCQRADRTLRQLLDSADETDPAKKPIGDVLDDEVEPTVTPDAIQDDSFSEQFDHGYCAAFDQEENIEALDECVDMPDQCIDYVNVLIEDPSGSEPHSSDDAIYQKTDDRAEAKESKNDSDCGPSGSSPFIYQMDDCCKTVSKTDARNRPAEATSHYKCSFCGKQFIHEKRLQHHIKYHLKTKQLADKNNEHVFSPSEGESEHNLESFECSSTTALTREREKDECKRKPLLLRNDYCNIRFSASFQSRKRSDVRCSTKTGLCDKTAERPFCKSCGRMFRFQSLLRRHARQCKGIVQYDFVRDVVDHYTDREFRKHFRMDRTTVDSLVEHFNLSEFFRVRVGGRQEISARSQILAFLWFCGKHTSFGKVCRLFRISNASFHKHMNLILDFLHQMSRDVIKFPASEHEKLQISAQFTEITPMASILGCIDSCFINCSSHFRKEKASQQPCDAFSKTESQPASGKPTCGIVLQAIADRNGKFLDVSTALMETTSLDDGHIFMHSTIAPQLKGICEDGRFQLLGSTCYPLRPYLLTPLRLQSSSKNVPPDVAATKYNESLKNTLELTIVAAFCTLKRRFPVLVKLRFSSPDKVDRFVLACCVLHNFCLDAGDMLGREDNEPDEEEEFTGIRFWQRPYRERLTSDGLEKLAQAGRSKRENIISTYFGNS